MSSTIFITGASSGIGKAPALEMAVWGGGHPSLSKHLNILMRAEGLPAFQCGTR